MTHEKDGFLTPEQLSERWGVSISTLACWRSKTRGQRGPKYISIGRKIRYPLVGVVDYESKFTQEPEPAAQTFR